MVRKIIFLILAVGVLFLVGCRTGEYNADLEIYEAMPGVLEGFPEITADMDRNEDGTLRVEFEKGEIRVWLRPGPDMDVVARREAASGCFEKFHDAYMQSELNKKKNGELYRTKIFLRGFLDDIELYVLEWDLSSDHPNVLSDREGNYF